MEDTLNLINELNSLSRYGINITNNSYNDKDFDECDDLSELNNIKTKEWKVTSIFNPKLGDMSYSAYNEDLKLAIKEVIEWCKENLKGE